MIVKSVRQPGKLSNLIHEKYNRKHETHNQFILTFSLKDLSPRTSLSYYSLYFVVELYDIKRRNARKQLSHTKENVSQPK